MARHGTFKGGIEKTKLGKELADLRDHGGQVECVKWSVVAAALLEILEQLHEAPKR
jgi:hypothetical protein